MWLHKSALLLAAMFVVPPASPAPPQTTVLPLPSDFGADYVIPNIDSRAQFVTGKILKTEREDTGSSAIYVLDLLSGGEVMKIAMKFPLVFDGQILPCITFAGACRLTPLRFDPSSLYDVTIWRDPKHPDRLVTNWIERSKP